MRIHAEGAGTPVWRVGLEPGSSGEILLDPEGLAALNAALEEAEADAGCRVMVLEGTAGAFCGGMDLGMATSAPSQQFSHEVQRFARSLYLIRSSRRVVISVVDGRAVGGGVGLAAAADICIASHRATFSLPELVLGLVPAVVLPILLERLPLQKVKLLCLSEGIGAQAALAWGLADRLVEDSSALEKAVRSAIKHCLRCDPGAVAELKSHAGRREGQTLQDALEAGARRLVGIMEDEETVRILEAFLEGEIPPWFHRYRSGGESP